jgi:hypothetical protein
VTGASLPVDGVRVFHSDLATGETFSTGSNTLVRVPRGGSITLGTGRLVFDAAGQVVEANGPDAATEIDQLCAALTG